MLVVSLFIQKEEFDHLFKLVEMGKRWLKMVQGDGMQEASACFSERSTNLKQYEITLWKGLESRDHFEDWHVRCTRCSTGTQKDG